MEAVRVTASSDQQGCGGVWSYTEDVDQGRRCRPSESVELSLEILGLTA